MIRRARKALGLNVLDLMSVTIIATLKSFLVYYISIVIKVWQYLEITLLNLMAELKHLHKLVNNKDISSLLASEGTSWTFSPSSAAKSDGI